MEEAILLPPKCGTWSHIPDFVSCSADPMILLGAYGCPIGRRCKKNMGWWHVQAPKGWRWVVNIGRDAELRDRSNWVRVVLSGNPLELYAFSFHSADVEVTTLGSLQILCGTVRDACDVPVYRTYRLRDPNSSISKQKEWLLRDTAELASGVLPQLGDPFAYWE